LKFLGKTLAALAGIRDTPERTALAFALGVFLAFSPLLGLHTALGILLAFLFRLNRVAVLLGVWTNLPWFLVPYYAFATWVGAWLLGMPAVVNLPAAGFSDVLTLPFWEGMAAQWRLLIPAFLGSTLLAGLFAVAAYPLALTSIRRFGRRQSRAGPPAGPAAQPGEARTAGGSLPGE
jgi:hypothetical protein